MNLTFLLQGPLGIAGPILLILLVLWMARGDRSPWYVSLAAQIAAGRVKKS